MTRHGYRIDVQGAKDSVSGLEYGRILNQMRGGEKEHTDRVSSLRLSWVTWFAQIALTRKTYSLPARLVIVLAVLAVNVLYAVFTVIFMQDVEASAASKRLRHRGARERVAELEKQAAVLEDVPDGDLFSGWAKSEDRMTRHQWQPLR